MEYLKRMTDALGYLEDHLAGEVDVKEASRVACSSLFHFQRMFHVIMGITVAEYVRKRRLTLAAQELASSQTKVIDVALKYGYETPESFCKAFHKAHGVTPSAARRAGTRLKVFPRLSFHLSLKGDKELDYRIVEKPAFQIAGRALRVSTKDDQNASLIPQFWTECWQDGTVSRLTEMSSEHSVLGKVILGVCMEFQTDMQEFTYLVCVEKTQDVTPDDFVVKDIPEAHWAVFESTGPMPDAIQKVWAHIFSEFFPSTGYEPMEDAPELELYYPGGFSDAGYRSEVWIPIVKQ